MLWEFKDFVNSVSDTASYNLRNLFLEVWKLAQMYHF